MGPAAEELKTVTIYWDGTTQDGVDETMQKPRYLFRSTDNECEAVMASLLTIKHFKGQRSEEHTYELQSLMRISYAVFCLKKKKNNHSLSIKYNTQTSTPQ